MPALFKAYRPQWLLWCVLSVAGSIWLARLELVQLREAFETDARISHRLLSQRTVQHEAVLATLALLQPQIPADGTDSAAKRLSSVYPQLLDIQQRENGNSWADAGLAGAEQQSRSSRVAALANVTLTDGRGRYLLVLAAQPSSYALLIDVHATIPWSEWSMPVQSSPVRVTLEHNGQIFVVQQGHTGSGGWRFEFRKHLASVSQPFEVVAVRQVGWHELPWGAMLLWVLAMAGVLAGWVALQRQKLARRRAEELLRVGQVSRLNALGELAAGMAHELNQPLTAILANTQAAKRLLDGDEAERATAKSAMDQAVAQARRAADVLGRLRRIVEQPQQTLPNQTVALEEVAKNVLALLEPECRSRSVTAHLQVQQTVQVLADRVALEQIAYNLVTNALQALEQVPPGERSITLQVSINRGTAGTGGTGILAVTDTGPGIPPESLTRIFEPFFSTREGGLGLGLSLCETLAAGMGGQLQASTVEPRGARFVLTLPLVTPP